MSGLMEGTVDTEYCRRKGIVPLPSAVRRRPSLDGEKRIRQVDFIQLFPDSLPPEFQVLPFERTGNLNCGGLPYLQIAGLLRRVASVETAAGSSRAFLPSCSVRVLP